MDILELHGRALDAGERIVAGVRPDQLELPTPCTEWDVRALLNHLVGGNLNSAARAEGTSRESDDSEDLLGDDPAGAYRRSAEADRRAWQAPGLLDTMYDMPMGRLPGRAALSIRVVETLTHCWDLARATGQDPRIDDDLAEAALAMVRRTLSPTLEGRRGAPFAPAVEVGDDLPAIDRLAAFMGRQP